jgi:hypothetical protein
MSGQGYEELIILNRKLDELLDRYNNLKLEVTEIKYERIKLSGALLGEGENALEAKKKITELVREIDRCVALLNR